MFSHFTVVKLIHVSHFFRQGYDGIGKQAAAFILAISGLCISVRCRRAEKRGAGNETPEDNDSQKQNCRGIMGLREDNERYKTRVTADDK